MPPIVASKPGSSGNVSPVDCRWRSSCLRVTPASTVASRSSALTRRIRVMRERSIVTPPRTGITCPSSEDPAPNATIGHAVPRTDPDDVADLLSGEWEDDGVRQATLVMRLAAAVVLAHGGNSRHAIADQVAEIIQECVGREGSVRRGHGSAYDTSRPASAFVKLRRTG